MSRQGKHKRSKVSIGIYAEREFRNLLVLVSDISGMTATDLLIEGITAKAEALGIVKDGVIADRYKGAIEIINAAYEEKRK